MPDPLTEDDRRTLQQAAYGAVALVSNADRGFFALFHESYAASGALAVATGLVRDVLERGEPPELSGADLEADVLPALRRSVEILRVKSPDDVASFTTTVLTAAERAAAASHGVRPAESAMLGKVKEALGAG